jgi:hypothetical protein
VSAHEAQAQAAGEEALERLFEAEEHGECACPTCIVREVLEAAWPHLRASALEDAADDLREVVNEFGNGDPSRFAVALGHMARRWRGE